MFAGAHAARAAFLDLRTVSSGLAGNSFTGLLDGVPVTASTDVGADSYTFNLPGSGFGNSTLDGTSPQYSYASVFDPAAPGVDRVGYSALGVTAGTITITFGSPVTNPRFHVANLSGVSYTFVLTGGLTGVSLVRGNGGDGDGLQVVGNVVSDANPNTFNGLPPTTPPPMTGGRSAYGTVSLDGTFTILSINIKTVGGDSASFTFSSVPEPAGTTALCVAGGALLRRRRCVV